MENEINGKIVELIDEENGIILGEDNQKYNFLKMDSLETFPTEVGQEVVFKPKEYKLENTIVRRATMITKK
jgi:hypothetical protein